MMAKPSEKLILTNKEKDFALIYVRASGFYKSRLANYLKISRPTLNRIFNDDPGFFTNVEAANAEFCKELIERAKDKNPLFLLERMFRKEFGLQR